MFEEHPWRETRARTVRCRPALAPSGDSRLEPEAGRQLQAAGQLGHGLGRGVAGLFLRRLDRRQHQVLEHLGIAGLGNIGRDLDGGDVAGPGNGDGDGPAAGAGFQRLPGQVFLRLGHVLLDFGGLLEHLHEVGHRYVCPFRVESTDFVQSKAKRSCRRFP